MRHTEHDLQSQCIKWFRLQYPRLSLNLFAIPNGAKRDVVSGRWYKKEGLTAGVSDVFLAIPSKDINVYDGKITDLHGVFIEFKSAKGKQTEPQIEFENKVRYHDYAYWIVRDFNDFMKKINNYIGEK